MQCEKCTQLIFLESQSNVARTSFRQAAMTHMWPERVRCFIEITLAAEFCVKAFSCSSNTVSSSNKRLLLFIPIILRRTIK